jgi:hypothetical protein
MKIWFSVFDKILFFSDLTKVVTGGIIVYNKPEQDCDGLPNTGKNRIEIDMSAKREDVYKEQHQVCVLLHEMVHTFVDIFSCNKKCCGKKLLTPDWGTLNGGHGSVWCNSMAAIEVALRRLVKWPESCSIAESVALEMKNGWQPRDEQLARWRVDLSIILVMISNTYSMCAFRHQRNHEDGDNVYEEEYEDEEDDEQQYVLCCAIS